MTVQSTLSNEAVRPAVRAIESVTGANGFVGRSLKSERRALVKLVLVSSDVLLALAVWQVAIAFLGVLGGGPISGFALASMVPNVIVWVGLRASLGLYPGYGLDQVEELRRQTFAVLATLTIVLVFASQQGDLLLSVLLFGWCLALLVFAPFMRCLAKRVSVKAALWGKPVVVLGTGETGAHVLKALRREWQLGFKPLAVFDDGPGPAGDTLEAVPYGGTLEDATALAHERGVDTAIFAMPHARHEHLAEFLDSARINFRHVVVVPDLRGMTSSAAVARDIAGTFGVEIKHNLLDPWAQRAKRLLDIVAVVTGGTLLLPLLLMLALLVRVESRGPIFYADKRMGRDGKLFSCIKFRTMVPDAEALLRRLLAEDTEMREEYLTYHKLRHDPRVTRVGRFLRKTSLDELPQLWNVLRGEMSLVGPRPYLPRESNDIGAAQDAILRATPGITGPWQVSGRNDTSFAQRVEMDTCYVGNWSVWLDLVLLARTVQCLLISRNAF